jgi:hypothetical protein
MSRQLDLTVTNISNHIHPFAIFFPRKKGLGIHDISIYNVAGSVLSEDKAAKA